MAKVSENFELARPVNQLYFRPTSYVSVDGREIGLNVQRDLPGDFEVRHGRYPLGQAVRIQGEIGHDGIVRGGTITYPLPGNYWTNGYVAQFKREMCKPEEPAEDYSLQLTPQ